MPSGTPNLPPPPLPPPTPPGSLLAALSVPGTQVPLPKWAILLLPPPLLPVQPWFSVVPALQARESSLSLRYRNAAQCGTGVRFGSRLVFRGGSEADLGVGGVTPLGPRPLPVSDLLAQGEGPSLSRPSFLPLLRTGCL
ncbi:UNVERIFIED_CONTAM: hypothetical protein K2H54_066847 [Gekko kuhli]